MYPIIRREAFSDTTFLWEVQAPDVAQVGRSPATSSCCACTRAASAFR